MRRLQLHTVVYKTPCIQDLFGGGQLSRRGKLINGLDIAGRPSGISPRGIGDGEQAGGQNTIKRVTHSQVGLVHARASAAKERRGELLPEILAVRPGCTPPEDGHGPAVMLSRCRTEASAPASGSAQGASEENVDEH